MDAKVKDFSGKNVSQNRKSVSLFGTIGDCVPETGLEYIPYFCGKDVQNRM